jgi:hypothetical protein
MEHSLLDHIWSLFLIVFAVSAILTGGRSAEWFFNFFSGLGKHLSQTNSPYKRNPTAFKPSTQTASNYVPFQPCRLFHGTSKENALEIYNTELWLIGDSVPASIWLTSKFDTAEIYAGNNGCVVVVQVHPEIKLTDQGNGVYIYEIPNTKPFQEYHDIKGLKPISVLDVKGNKVR